MRCRGTWKGWLFVLVGCAPAPTLLDADEGDIAAAVVFDASGEVVEVSPLVDPFVETLFVPASGERVSILLWDRDAVGIAEGLGGPALTSVRETCQPRLPEPKDVVTLRGAPIDSPPPLTGPWMQEGCPEPLEDARLEILCLFNNRCPTVATPISRCRARFEPLTDACQFPPFQVWVDPNGQACFQTDGVCTPRESPREAVGAASCNFSLDGGSVQRCNVVVAAPPAQPAFEPPEVVRFHDLEDVRLPDFVIGAELLLPSHLQRTLMSSAVVLPDQVAVATVEPLSRRDRVACGWGEASPMTLRRFDRRTLEAVSETPLPPCTLWLAGSAAEDVVFGVYPNPEEGTWTVARWAGTETATRALDPVLFPPASTEIREIERGPNFLAVLADVGGEARVARLDLTTLGRMGDVMRAPGPSVQLGLSEDIVFVVQDGRTRNIYRGRTQLSSVASAPSGVENTDIAFDPSTGRILIAISRDIFGVLTIAAPPSVRVHGRWANDRFQTTRMAPWTGHPGVALVTGFAKPSAAGWVALLTRFDVEEGRFLQADVPLGPGAPTALTVDEEGVAWIALGWSGRLVRVRPSLR